jgi:hypothetical protein
MINLCVIHNNEAPRLEYLRAQIGGLAKALETDGISLRLYDVGPEASGMAGQVPQDSFLNRLKRAWAAAWLFAGYARHDPRRRTDRLRYARLWFRHFKSILFDYRRSIRIEQEVLYAHGHAWKIASRTALPTIVLESDAIFPEGAIENLVSLIKWSLPQLEQEYFFADLAGGCSTQEILNSWCFEEGFGMRTTQVGAIDIQILPSLTAGCSRRQSRWCRRTGPSIYSRCKSLVLPRPRAFTPILRSFARDRRTAPTVRQSVREAERMQFDLGQPS